LIDEEPPLPRFVVCGVACTVGGQDLWTLDNLVRARKWVVLEVELARKYQKWIVGADGTATTLLVDDGTKISLPSFGAAEMRPEAAALVDVQCPWDDKEIIVELDSAAVG
jgi:hypothetical protein